MLRSSRGFTLIELNQVLGIVGVLAAVAVPSYLIYLRGSRATEGPVLMRAVAHWARVAAEEGRSLVACGPTPSEVPGEEPVPFGAEPCWADLGFLPSQQVHFQLELIPRPAGGFTVRGTSDLDGDGVLRILTLESRDDEIRGGGSAPW